MDQSQISLRAPAVTVIIVTYNCERYLPIAVNSILGQTFSDLELIVINNASTDRTGAYLDTIRDPRFVRIDNRINGGPQAANLGLPKSRGKYIARLDADDVALPGRLEAQYRFLEARPSVGLVGSEYEEIDQNGVAGALTRSLLNPFAIRWKLGWENFIGHSTIMARKDIVVRLGGYREDLWCVQDYDLISRFSLASDVAMLPECLVQYRVYPTSITHTRSEEMIRTSLQVSVRHLEASLGKSLGEETAIAAVKIMRNRACHPEIDLSGPLRLIQQYTSCQAQRSPVKQAAFIRRETAGQLLRYARSHLGGNRTLRLSFEMSILAIYPWQFVSRAHAVLKRRNKSHSAVVHPAS